MKMPRVFNIVALTLALTLFGFAMASPAEAVKLRRPYTEGYVFNYGFDNNYGSAGCTDYNCGGHCYDGHGGTDFAMPVGTNLLAGEDGTVTAVNNSCGDYGSYGNTCGGRCGNYVKITHDDGQFSMYCHMKRNSLTVSVGQRVSCGQKVGQSASSGSSTGPHLHVQWQSGSGFRDTFRGSCTNSSGVWRQQNGYREPVGTSCGCEPSTEVCDGKDNNCDGEVDEGDVCEDEFLAQSPNRYAPASTTDINGDGLQDVCGRGPDGWTCYLSTGNGWGDKIASGQMTDGGGWGSRRYYATIRTGDVDGDGLADVCGRHSTKGYQCWRSTGDGFEHYANAPGYTNAEGWTDPGYYTTFRLTDINGDGKDDVCARGPDGWSCQLSTGTGFGETVAGPAWTDASGYNRAWYYGTIRTGDINGDGKQDVCIRRAAGFDCYTSTGTSFERFKLVEDFSNDGGWKDMKYWSTLSLFDYNGDGKDDVCARFFSGFRCMKATATGFAAPEEVLATSAELDLDALEHFATFRAGDINGDGAENVCVRGVEGVDCFSPGTPKITGPRWKDSSGWSRARYYSTLTVTDIDPDRRRDICARASAGWMCRRTTDDGFASVAALDAFSNANGWDAEKYYSTMRMGSGTCRAELCNGFDDDCDGKIDEGSPTRMGHVPPAIAAKFVDSTVPENADIGTEVEAVVRFENMGRDTWSAGEIALQAVGDTSDALDALRPASGWQDATTPAVLGETVAPGEIATLTFMMRVPADAATFDEVLFVLNANDKPIACPSPSATVGMGVTTPEEEDPNDHNNTPGGDAGPDNPDGGMAENDVTDSDRDSTLYSASSSSCACSSTDNPPSPLSTALWPGVLMMSLFWMRRRKASADKLQKTRLTMMAVLLVMPLAGAGLMGCDSPATSTEGEAVPAQNKSAKALDYVPAPHADQMPASAPVEEPKLDFTSTRLLAVYRGWELRGQPLPLLPQSDQPPSMIAELSFEAKVVDWPLGAAPLTNAVFIPSADGEPVSVAVRTPDARLLLVTLDEKNKQNPGEVELDRDVGFSIAVAENGCCLAYMRGALADQSKLNILTLADDNLREIQLLTQNAWSPAISPDGRQVIYTAPTETGDPAIYQVDVARSEANTPTAGRLVAERLEVFPAGPNPPFWTAQGIAFASERGSYRMDANGNIFEGAPHAQGLILDLESGAMLDSFGRPLRLAPMK
ncbi:peptidoglycan DD-metalloendopeptidase family protein [Bradymonas sediminis]|uniref:M23ase beta-sheet core domain-containing protein n=1 Tax=Bradymonas sediminis TaxID=1548548 RepID=A0A2Z4FHZ4_9DELT|nr:peptidoglycan DD-metalloendopeptidase family protein [Bradymonas sediminis]AWV88374.1 hypothetical protein DN745_03050 [Bradymonas sediminis]TDP77501.1 MYXO-CTERM domain-containing protein [Bradymonas sediminis]